MCYPYIHNVSDLVPCMLHVWFSNLCSGIIISANLLIMAVLSKKVTARVACNQPLYTTGVGRVEFSSFVEHVLVYRYYANSPHTC